jgi:hypothetical protein
MLSGMKPVCFARSSRLKRSDRGIHPLSIKGRKSLRASSLEADHLTTFPFEIHNQPDSAPPRWANSAKISGQRSGIKAHS